MFLFTPTDGEPGSWADEGWQTANSRTKLFTDDDMTQHIESCWFLR